MKNEQDSLGLRLLYADTEAAVSAIVASDIAMYDDANWHPVDNRETNFNTVSNQSSNGGKAATELITNMVDAVLTKRCLEEGINPKADDAPPTMYAAVDKFIRSNISGKITNADNAWLKKYSSKNLIIGVTGSPKGEMRPCYTFCDNGEGQSPEKFADTFLSLSAKNKSEIPFVQGKYNMGSSGVLNYCGKMWYKLIVSRRYDKNTSWGWTLIRKKEAKGTPYAEYFAPNCNIQTITGDEIFPFRINTGERFDGFSLQSGTIIKLYEYYAGKTHSGFRATREVFNENMVETILPFRIYDFRNKPDPNRGGLRKFGIDERPFYGLEFLLRRTHQDDEATGNQDISKGVGDPIQVSTAKHLDLGEINIIAIPVSEEGSKAGWFRSSPQSRVFHHVNGQVQYKKTRGFLTQCGLPNLKDRIVIFVDASKLDDGAHHDTWKGDRQTIKETQVGETYEDFVKDLIKESPDLKELNYKIGKQALDSAVKEGGRDMIKNLVQHDRHFADLLQGIMPDGIVVDHGQPAEAKLRDDLKYDPTYIKVKRGKVKMQCPINKMCTIECDTDAKDDFFTRTDNRGWLLFSDDDVAEKFNFHYKLLNGELVAFMKPSLVNVGDKFTFRIIATADSMAQPVVADKEVTIEIAAKTPTKEPKPPVHPIDPPSKQVNFPDYKLLTKDGREVMGQPTDRWDSCTAFNDIDEQDGGYVADLGEELGKIHYINYDNASFHRYRSSQKPNDRAAVDEKYVLAMRILMLGIERSFDSLPDEKGEQRDIFSRYAVRGVAYVAMTMCDQLPKVFDLLPQDDSDE